MLVGILYVHLQIKNKRRFIIMEETRKVMPIEEVREDAVENPGVYVDSEERKIISLEEFVEIMTANAGKKFDTRTENLEGLEIDMIFTDSDFEKYPAGELFEGRDEYYEIRLFAKNTGNIIIESEIIDAIYLYNDGSIQIEFNINISDMFITFINQ